MPAAERQECVKCAQEQDPGVPATHRCAACGYLCQDHNNLHSRREKDHVDVVLLAAPPPDETDHVSDTESELEDDIMGEATESEDDEEDDAALDDDGDESDELTSAEEDILARALEALDHITKSGGANFNFGKRHFLESHLRQWRRKKDRAGKYRVDLRFASAKESVGGGRTQTGKTALKAALGILARLCGVTVVVVTTTTGNRDGICDDLNSERYFGQLTGEFEDCQPLCTTIAKREMQGKDHDKFLEKCIYNHGVIVVNCTGSAVDKVRNKISLVRGNNQSAAFALIKDEGDTLDRRFEGKTDVVVTLRFAGSQHEFKRKEAGLKSLIAATIQGCGSFSKAQEQKLADVYEDLKSSWDEPDYDELARQLNDLEGGARDVGDLKPRIRTWIKKRHVSLGRVSIDFKESEDGGGTVTVYVKVPNCLEEDTVKKSLGEADRDIAALGFARQGEMKIRAEDPEFIALERAMHRLTGKLAPENGGSFGAPVSILSVSATTLPIFIRLLQEDKMGADTFIVQPSEKEYVGLSNSNMEPSFLVPNELALRNEYWSPSVEELYRDAHPDKVQDQRAGMLLIDAVNPRVRAHTNTKDRAMVVKRKFPRFHIIVLSGTGGMQCNFAGESRWYEKEDLCKFVHGALTGSLVDGNQAADEDSRSDSENDDRPARRSSRGPNKTKQKLKTPSVSELLTAIVKTKGIGTPIAVIGYTRMLRGESFVSSAVSIDGEERRIVPTHMVCGLLPGRSVEDLVQMAGRVTNTGRKVLDRNLGQENAKVKILIPYKDWDLAVAYYRFQDEVFKLLKEGKSIQEVLSDACPQIEYDYSSDITAFMGKRTIGAKKRNNTLKVRWKRPPPDDVQRIKEMHPGKAWAFEHGNMEYDTKGQEWKLCSPISTDQRFAMTAMERDIEEYLYHEKEAFSSVAIILRRALMLAKDEWQQLDPPDDDPAPEPLEEDGHLRWEIEKLVDADAERSRFKVRWMGYAPKFDSWMELAELENEVEDLDPLIEQFEREGPERTYFTRSGEDGTIDRERLIEDHAKLRVPRGVRKLIKAKGYQRFEPARATNTASWRGGGTWWQKKGSCWPIFVAAEPRSAGRWQNAAQSAGERLALNPDIISFAQRYAAEISRDPPAHTFEEIQRFCVDRGILQEDAAENLPHVDGSPAPPMPRRGRPAGSIGKNKCSRCGKQGHNKTTCPQRPQREHSSEDSSGEGSSKGARKRAQTDAEADASDLRSGKVSRTLDM